MQNGDPNSLLIKIVKVLERLKIPYFVTGGMAVTVWGRPRFTADIDVIVQMQPKDVITLEKTLSAISEASYIDIDSIRNALNQYGEFNFVDGESGMKVDFWILKNTPFGMSQLKRRKIQTVLRKKIYFVSPEDLILSKLIWHKESPTGRQLDDVESVLRVSKEKLDYKYLKTWAIKLDLGGILSEVLKNIF
jgi:hypothetical protein